MPAFIIVDRPTSRPSTRARSTTVPAIAVWLHALSRDGTTSMQSPIDNGQYFDISGTMDIQSAVRSLAALAQDSRLEVFRLLVQAGPDGLAAGEIAERLDIPASTLSFHVKALAQSGLVESRQTGRFIYYSASFAAMNDLVAFLGENCCGGRSCVPVATSGRRKRAS